MCGIGAHESERAPPLSDRKEARMCRKISLVLVLVCLSISCAGFKGCSVDEAEDGLTTVKDLTSHVTPYVPTSHTYIPAAISALCTAALSLIKIIKEQRETQRMKTAIKVKARQIDQVISAPANPDPNKENPVLTFLRKDKSLADDKKHAALCTFDAVRKGYI